MLQRLLIIAALAVPPLALLYLDGHGHAMPRWLLVLAALPLFVWGYVTDDESDADSAIDRFFRGFSILWLIGASLFLIAIGTAGWALRGQGSLLEIFAFALPFGVVALAFAIWRLFSSRD